MTASETAKAQLKTGDTFAALQTLATGLEQTPKDADLYLAASRAMLKAAEIGLPLTQWDGFAALARRLLHHNPCPTSMLTFAHEAASAMTSGHRKAVTALTDILSGIINAELGSDPAQNPGYKNVLVFALTIRGLAGDWLDQTHLSKKHLEWFERFETADLSLPYSVMFNPDQFCRNRDDVLAAYWHAPNKQRLQTLSPDRVLFFSWLAGQPAFCSNDKLTDYLDTRLPGTDEDRAAARALIMHHRLHPAPTKLDQWGLSDITALLDGIAARTALPLQKQTRFGARHLHNKAYQALNAAKHLYTPFLAGRGKPKVAICVSGQLRGYETALATWKKALLPFIEPVFFLHSWTGIGRSDAQPFRYVLPFAGQAFPDAYRSLANRIGYEDVRARYPTLFSALDQENSVCKETLQATYDTPYVMLEDDKAPPFETFSNQQKMHYKIHAADTLAQNHGGFDLHMRLRPDLAIKLVGFDWRDLKAACASRPVLFAEKPFGLHYANLMIGDQCAIGTPEVMKIYAGTWVSFPQLAKANIARCPSDFTGHVSLALTAWTHGLGVERLPVRFGTLQEATPLNSQAILKALKADTRADADDQSLINAVKADLAR